MDELITSYVHKDIFNIIHSISFIIIISILALLGYEKLIKKSDNEETFDYEENEKTIDLNENITFLSKVKNNYKRLLFCFCLILNIFLLNISQKYNECETINIQIKNNKEINKIEVCRSRPYFNEPWSKWEIQ